MPVLPFDHPNSQSSRQSETHFIAAASTFNPLKAPFVFAHSLSDVCSSSSCNPTLVPRSQRSTNINFNPSTRIICMFFPKFGSNLLASFLLSVYLYACFCVCVCFVVLCLWPLTSL